MERSGTFFVFTNMARRFLREKALVGAKDFENRKRLSPKQVRKIEHTGFAGFGDCPV
jgi:hypothetical protein